MNPRRQMIVAALAAVVVTVLFFFLALRPKLAQISETRDEIATAEQEERRLLDELQQLRDAQEDRPTTVARLAIANTYVPTGPDLPDFIRLLQSAASASGASLESIAPQPPRELDGAQGVEVIDVTLTVNGAFRRLEDFLVRLESLERLVEVRSMTLQPEEDELSGQTILSTSIALQMYVAEEGGRAGGAGSGAAPTATPTPEATP